MKAGRVKRSIYFYRAIVNGQRDPLLMMDVSKINACIDALQWDDNAVPSRYFRNASGEVFMVWADLIEGRLRLQVARERPEDSPSIENRGEVRHVTIGTGEHFIEPLQAVMFKNNIVGSVFNQLGPRMNHVSEYLNHICTDKIEFELLVKKDVESQLQRIGAIRTLDVTIHPSSAGLFDGHDNDLDEAMNAVRRIRDAETVRVIFNAGTKRGAHLGGGMRSAVMSILKRAPVATLADRFRVSGPDPYTGKDRVIDLLAADIVARKDISREGGGSKALDEQAAYRAIEEAYGEHLEEFPSVEIRGPR